MNRTLINHAAQIVLHDWWASVVRSFTFPGAFFNANLTFKMNNCI